MLDQSTKKITSKVCIYIEADFDLRCPLAEGEPGQEVPTS